MSKAKKIVKAAKVSKAAKVLEVVKPTLETAYRTGGGYANSVLALKALGVGKLHSFDAILKAVKKVYGPTAWGEFAAIKPRNKKTGKDADGRALQNVMVISRLDYGAPLKDCGYECRWNGREKVAGLFKLGSK